MQLLAAALDPARVAVAHAVAFAPALPMVFQSPVAGAPLDLLLSRPKPTALACDPRVRAGVGCAAAALAALHQVAAASERLRPVGAELERLARRSAQIRTVAPRVGAALHTLAQALPAWLDQLPSWGAETRLVHGDCKPGQFLIMPPQNEGGAAVALLDFDHCGMADPAADVGAFLASLRQLEIRQALKQRRAYTPGPAALEELFLSAYLAAGGGHPNFRRRAAWHQAVALLRKALRSFARSPRSPLPTLLVDEAWRCLQDQGMTG
jgi:aminoglycoside phosphotransferase (APT) family kinase protein